MIFEQALVSLWDMLALLWSRDREIDEALKCHK